MSRALLSAAAISGAAAVALGAFGAHSLRDSLSVEQMRIFQTGVSYHFYHTAALTGAGVLNLFHPSRWWLTGGALFTAGILFFSGSLYLLATLPHWQWLGPITPLGGLCFMAAWLCLLAGAFRLQISH